MLAPEVVAGIYTPEETEDFQPSITEVAAVPTKSFDITAKLVSSALSHSGTGA